MEKITFCIPSKSNLRYLKTCLASIRKNAYRKDHDIVIFVDSDEDGTLEWLNKNQSTYEYTVLTNPNLGTSLYGIGKAYDECIKSAKTPVCMIFHADMMLGKDADYHAFKYLKPLTVVSSTRIEPPIHPNAGEKILKDFGMWPEEFKEDAFNLYVQELINQNENKTTEGIFAPWMIYREDLLSIGGHDAAMHSCREDSDLFNRFVLNEYKLVQSWDSLVYHLTGRGAGSFDGDPQRHEQWKQDMENSTREFIRKWGSNVKHTALMKPIISPKYDIGYVVNNCGYPLLKALEPWCSTLYIKDDMNLIISDYVNKEQPSSKFNLRERIKSYDSEKQNNILVSFDASKLTGDNFQILTQLPDIIQDSGEIGSFELDIFQIDIIHLTEYQQSLINAPTYE